MQPTVKLYEEDAMRLEFSAAVLACEPAGEGWRAALDATAFYPEGGGQPADTGRLDGAAVRDVQMDNGVIWHTLDAPLPVGAQVEGAVDAARRRDACEQHTGEHILSGTLHRLFGAENVGFHIGSPAVRMDMDLPLSAAQLAEAEAEANAAVRADRPVRAWYPAPEELAALTYRSKKAIDGPVRLVDAGGADLCACCGTHLASTGQVGLIKILSAQNYKGGTRLAVACGGRAQAAVAETWADAEACGALLSAGPGRLAVAAGHALEASAARKQRLAILEHTLAETCAAAAAPGKAACLLLPGTDGDALRHCALAAAAKSGAPCLALAPGGRGLRYVLAAAPGSDVRPLANALNEACSGRGGGSTAVCQGSLAAEPAAVKAWFAGAV